MAIDKRAAQSAQSASMDRAWEKFVAEKPAMLPSIRNAFEAGWRARGEVAQQPRKPTGGALGRRSGEA